MQMHFLLKMMNHNLLLHSLHVVEQQNKKIQHAERNEKGNRCILRKKQKVQHKRMKQLVQIVVVFTILMTTRYNVTSTTSGLINFAKTLVMMHFKHWLKTTGIARTVIIIGCIVSIIFPNIHTITILLYSKSLIFFNLDVFVPKGVVIFALVENGNLLHSNFWLPSVGNICLLCNKIWH